MGDSYARQVLWMDAAQDTDSGASPTRWALTPRRSYRPAPRRSIFWSGL